MPFHRNPDDFLPAAERGGLVDATGVVLGWPRPGGPLSERETRLSGGESDGWPRSESGKCAGAEPKAEGTAVPGSPASAATVSAFGQSETPSAPALIGPDFPPGFSRSDEPLFLVDTDSDDRGTLLADLRAFYPELFELTESLHRSLLGLPVSVHAATKARERRAAICRHVSAVALRLSRTEAAVARIEQLAHDEED